MTHATAGLPIVAAFGDRRRAARAARALRAAGPGTGRVWLLVPPHVDWAGLRALVHHQPAAAVATELGRALVDAGVPDGPARYYERAFTAGDTLVVVQSSGHANARAVLRRHGGWDLEQIGGELARAPELQRASPGGRPPVGSDLTWRDVACHYETLFDQRYGVGEATWASMHRPTSSPGS